MPEPLPDPVRNRRGCFILLATLALFVALYLYSGFRAEPGNNASETIPAVPSGQT